LAAAAASAASERNRKGTYFEPLDAVEAAKKRDTVFSIIYETWNS
jgi:hypothetical protein